MSTLIAVASSVAFVFVYLRLVEVQAQRDRAFRWIKEVMGEE